VSFLATRQDLGLLYPVFLLDAALEAQFLTEASNVRRFPGSDIGKTSYPKISQCVFEPRIDVPDACQVVARSWGGSHVRRSMGAGWAAGCCCGGSGGNSARRRASRGSS
jgi:hypothetical protein